MSDNLEIPELHRLATAYAPVTSRGTWTAWFALDAHLAALVGKASEPMLGQIRLAWWRDRLGEERGLWPKGNPVLSALARDWPGDADTLIPLVDGWENLLVEPPIGPESIASFAEGRAQSLTALATAADHTNDVARAARRWAVADLLVHSGHAEERATILGAAKALGPEPVRLPREYRPLAILDGLARRTLAKGGGPLFEGRAAALAVLRLGMFGR